MLGLGLELWLVELGFLCLASLSPLHGCATCICSIHSCVLLSSRFAAARQLLASGSASAGSVRYIRGALLLLVVVLLRRFKESYTHSHRVLHHDKRPVNFARATTSKLLSTSTYKLARGVSRVVLGRGGGGVGDTAPNCCPGPKFLTVNLMITGATSMPCHCSEQVAQVSQGGRAMLHASLQQHNTPRTVLYY